MKKFLVVFLLGLLIAGSAFAQNYGNAQAAPTPQIPQTISGILQIINGTLAIVGAANQVYYVPSLQPYYGAYGLYVNTFVSVYGTIANNYCSPYSFMTGGTTYTLPGSNIYLPPVQPKYVPPAYVPPVVLVVPVYPPYYYYPRYYGW